MKALSPQGVGKQTFAAGQAEGGKPFHRRARKPSPPPRGEALCNAARGSRHYKGSASLPRGEAAIGREPSEAAVGKRSRGPLSNVGKTPRVKALSQEACSTLRLLHCSTLKVARVGLNPKFLLQKVALAFKVHATSRKCF
jgi:hypothetical protein